LCFLVPFHSAFQMGEVKAGNDFKIGNDDPQGTAGAKDPVTLAQKFAAVRSRQMFENMRMVNDVEALVGKRERLSKVVLQNPVSDRTNIYVRPFGMEPFSTPKI